VGTGNIPPTMMLVKLAAALRWGGEMGAGEISRRSEIHTTG